jgi:hypothetical protein
MSRVENRRSDCSRPVAADEAFASSPQSGLVKLCFLFLLIEPDRRIWFRQLAFAKMSVYLCPAREVASVELTEVSARTHLRRQRKRRP